ncbi:lactose permease [Magnaporthiopsis poae ATCC 64411]|uniref:Lactose permease n=1 Tax=Magnaporthiopsis poae (strain ATCC 64411 / 73-15) TaxID=644358 RepID=A0A0C4E9Y7_MAGP6|nr:lactose permease [Magnaporthiopsis poae ATCC 64411]
MKGRMAVCLPLSRQELVVLHLDFWPWGSSSAEEKRRHLIPPVKTGVSDEKKEDAPGSDFAAVLPKDGRPWYRTPHLILLNLLLMVLLLSSIIVGYGGSMMSGLQILTFFKHDFSNPAGDILGLMNSVYPLGKVVGLFVVTPVADRFGRKTPMAIGLVGCIVFAITQGLSPNPETFVVSRAFLGFWTSSVSQPSPVLIAELAYPTQRGQADVALQHLPLLWRHLCRLADVWHLQDQLDLELEDPVHAQGAIPFLQLAALWFVPESPRYLVSWGRSDEARRALVKYHAGGDADSPLVAFEMAEIERAMAAEKDESSSTSSWLHLCRGPANRRRTLIAIIVGVFSYYYLTLVLNTIGITDPRDQTLINGLLQIFNWLAGHLCRRHDGQPPRPPHLVPHVDLGPRCSRPTRWRPIHTRSAAAVSPSPSSRPSPVSSSATQANPIAMEAIQWRYYIVFCCLLAVLLALIYLLFPETKGRTLQEVCGVFEGPTAATVMDPKGRGGCRIPPRGPCPSYRV